MHFQVLVHPEGVEGGGVKAGQEHVYHNEQIHFPGLHPSGKVLVVVLEPIRRGVKVGVEHSIIILNGAVQEVPRGLVQPFRLEALFRQAVLRIFLVGGKAEDGGNGKVSPCLCELASELLVILHGHGDGIKSGHSLPFQGVIAVALGLLVKML